MRVEETVDILGVVEAVIDEELELGDDAELVARALSQLVAYLAHVGVDVITYLLCTLTGEDAQVAAADAHIGADAAGGDGDEDTLGGLCLSLEDIAQLLLDEAGDFILSGRFHLSFFTFHFLFFTPSFFTSL